MKKPARCPAKLRLVLQREIVLHLTREQLAQVAGASGKTMCEGCHNTLANPLPPGP